MTTAKPNASQLAYAYGSLLDLKSFAEDNHLSLRQDLIVSLDENAIHVRIATAPGSCDIIYDGMPVPICDTDAVDDEMTEAKKAIREYVADRFSLYEI